MHLNGAKKQPLDSRQLLLFVTVARTRSFTRAGRELYLSQSAVSHAVKSLEDELGHRLLDRDGKKMQITPAGEHLLHYAEKILKDMSVARVSLDQRTRWGTSRLRLGANSSFSPCLLPGIIQSFRGEFPDWPVSVKVGDTRECVDWLEDNEIDMAIAIAPSQAEAVEVTPLFTDEVLWIVPPGHPWAKARTAVAEEVSSQNFICNNASSYSARLLEKYFERDGIRLKCSMELGTLEAVKEMVKTGAGITALSPWAVRKELDEKSLVPVPLGKRKLKRNWCMLRSPGRKSGLAEETFARFSLEATKALMSVTSIAAAVVNTFLLGAGMEWDFLAVAV
jgi:DNA-binding transcriptional LysR family regulator